MPQSLLTWSLLALAIVGELLGTVSLKHAEGMRHPLAWVVVYALWSGVGIALTALAGVVFYDERMDFPKVCGLLAIAFGAVLLQLSSK